MDNKQSNFSVSCYYTFDTEDKNYYSNWYEGCKMIIQKDNITIRLNEDEIKQIVESLPRTIGGSY